MPPTHSSILVFSFNQLLCPPPIWPCFLIAFSSHLHLSFWIISLLTCCHLDLGPVWHFVVVSLCKTSCRSVSSFKKHVRTAYCLMVSHVKVSSNYLCPFTVIIFLLLLCNLYFWKVLFVFSCWYLPCGLDSVSASCVNVDMLNLGHVSFSALYINGGMQD